MVSDVTAEVGDDVATDVVAAALGDVSAVDVSVLDTESDEFGAEDSFSNPIKGVGTGEKPKEAYSSLSLRSRDFISAKALIVPEARRHAIANMASLLVTDWSPKMDVATNNLICPQGKAAAAPKVLLVAVVAVLPAEVMASGRHAGNS